MVYYKLVKIIIDILGLTKVIINMVVRHYDLPDITVTDQMSFFTSKFWLLLSYFLNIKQRLSTAFYLQTDGKIVRQNSTVKAYLQAFVNFEQNDRVQFLLMAEFAYKNVKNASTSHTSFKLNCKYYLYVVYKEDLNFCLK